MTTPAYKTTKFWALVLMTNIGLLLTSGVVLPGTVAVAIGWVVTVLTALGFKTLPPPVDPTNMLS